MMHQTFRRMRHWSIIPVDNQPAHLDCLDSDAKSVMKKSYLSSNIYYFQKVLSCDGIKVLKISYHV